MARGKGCRVNGWPLVGFLMGLVALVIGVPPMLGWSNEKLLVALGLGLVCGAIGWLFVPVPKPHAEVDCGSVAHPKNEWTGEPLDFGPGPGGVDMSSYPDFHRQCSGN